MATITIVGAGLMGTAVAWPLCDNGHDVRLVGTHLDAEIIRSCLKTGYHPRLRRQLPPMSGPTSWNSCPRRSTARTRSSAASIRWACIGSVARSGRCSGRAVSSPSPRDWRRRPRATRASCPTCWPASCPPACATASRSPSAGRASRASWPVGGRRASVFTGRDEAARCRLRGSSGPPTTTSGSTDLVGVEVCAAMKNAYTVAVGLARGLLERGGSG